MRALTYTHHDYEEIATDTHLILIFNDEPAVDHHATFTCADGSTLRHGDRIHGMDGPNTAAGFPKFLLADGYLTYQGMLTLDNDKTAVCFRAFASDDSLWPGHEAYPYSYIVFYAGSHHNLIFHTPQCAGRVIHTHSVARWSGANLPEEWDHAWHQRMLHAQADAGALIKKWRIHDLNDEDRDAAAAILGRFWQDRMQEVWLKSVLDDELFAALEVHAARRWDTTIQQLAETADLRDCSPLFLEDLFFNKTLMQDALRHASPTLYHKLCAHLLLEPMPQRRRTIEAAVQKTARFENNPPEQQHAPRLLIISSTDAKPDTIGAYTWYRRLGKLPGYQHHRGLISVDHTPEALALLRGALIAGLPSDGKTFDETNTPLIKLAPFTSYRLSA